MWGERQPRRVTGLSCKLWGDCVCLLGLEGGGRRDGQTTLGRVYRECRTSLNLRVLRMESMSCLVGYTLMLSLSLPRATHFWCVQRRAGKWDPHFPFLFWETSGALKSNSSGLQSSSTLGKLLSFWDLGLFPCRGRFYSSASLKGREVVGLKCVIYIQKV